MWINPENPGQGQSTRLIGKQCNGNTNVGPYWTINLYGAGSGGSNPLLSSNGANQTDGVDSAVISYSTWSYVVATYLNGDGGTNKLYHNGSLLKTGTTAYSTPFGYSANYPILFGNSGNWNNGKSYKLGPVHIYNKVLTDVEVSKNYNVMKHRFGI